jgi:hypothetical protein
MDENRIKMNKYIDYKITQWKRLYLDDSTDMKKITEIIESLGFHISVINRLFDKDLGFSKVEPLYETEEAIDPEVEQRATLEIYDNNKLIYKNF